MDSNGDGVGDLQGIIGKLDFLVHMGYDALWLSPIYPSPMADFGYDVSDYSNVHAEYGTLEDFDELVKECRIRKVKVILDFVPNHCSTEHPWFKSALSSTKSCFPFKVCFQMGCIHFAGQSLNRVNYIHSHVN